MNKPISLEMNGVLDLNIENQGSVTVVFDPHIEGEIVIRFRNHTEMQEVTFSNYLDGEFLKQKILYVAPHSKFGTSYAKPQN